MADILDVIKGIKMCPPSPYPGPLVFWFSPGWFRVEHLPWDYWMPCEERMRFLADFIDTIERYTSRRYISQLDVTNKQALADRVSSDVPYSRSDANE